MPMPRLNIAGKRFGRLTVIKPVRRKSRKTTSIIWKCRCTCGKTVFVDATSLNRGRTKSCGCLRTDNFSVWRLKQRDIKKAAENDGRMIICPRCNTPVPWLTRYAHLCCVRAGKQEALDKMVLESQLRQL